MVASDRLSAFDFVLRPTIPDKGAILTAHDRCGGSTSSRRGRQPPDHREWTTRRSRRVARAGPCSAGAWTWCRRVRRPRLPAGSGLARVPGHGHGLRGGAARRAGRRRPAARADLHPGHQGRRSASTTRTSPTSSGRRVGADDGRRAPRADAGDLRAGRRHRRRARDHPGRHQVRVRPRRGRRGLVLGDEVLTPDSSRFWPADEWQPGRAQPSFDKQYVRDWLTGPDSGWDRGRQPAAAAARRGRRRHPSPLRGGLRAAHRAAASPTGRAEPIRSARRNVASRLIASPRSCLVARVVVDVVLKPEILDPAGPGDRRRPGRPRASPGSPTSGRASTSSSRWTTRRRPDAGPAGRHPAGQSGHRELHRRVQ